MSFWLMSIHTKNNKNTKSPRKTSDEELGHSYSYAFTEREGRTKSGENTQDYHFIGNGHWTRIPKINTFNIQIPSCIFSDTLSPMTVCTLKTKTPAAKHPQPWGIMVLNLKKKSYHPNSPLYPQASTTPFWSKDTNAIKIKTKGEKAVEEKSLHYPLLHRYGRYDVKIDRKSVV